MLLLQHNLLVIVSYLNQEIHFRCPYIVITVVQIGNTYWNSWIKTLVHYCLRYDLLLSQHTINYLRTIRCSSALFGQIASITYCSYQPKGILIRLSKGVLLKGVVNQLLLESDYRLTLDRLLQFHSQFMMGLRRTLIVLGSECISLCFLFHNWCFE